MEGNNINLDPANNGKEIKEIVIDSSAFDKEFSMLSMLNKKRKRENNGNKKNSRIPKIKEAKSKSKVKN